MPTCCERARPWWGSPDHRVRSDPAGCARAARTAVQQHSSSVIVHFDDDAVDSRDLPLADFLHYGTGVPLEVAGEVLAVLCGTAAIAAIVLTEVNPSHDPSGRQLARYLRMVSTAIAAGIGDA